MRISALLTLFAAVALAGPAVRVDAQQPQQIPTKFRTIYPPPAEAQADVQKAMALGAAQHKRILIEFGTNECADCQVLAKYFHNDINHAQIAEHFLLVPVNVGKDLNKNLDLAHRFGVPVHMGIPAMAVIDGDGHVIYAQQHGEFRNARNMSDNDVTVFLNHWRQ